MSFSIADAEATRLDCRASQESLRRIVSMGGSALKWPSNLPTPERSIGSVTTRDSCWGSGRLGGWEKANCHNWPGNPFDCPYRGFSAIDIEGRWLFRFPYAITPVADDQGMSGSTVEVSPDESYLLINGHAYVRDIFPVEVPGIRDGRLEVGFIYRLLSQAGMGFGTRLQRPLREI